MLHLLQTDMEEIPQWPPSVELREKYAVYLTDEEEANIHPFQIAEWMSKGLVAEQKTRYHKFKDTTMICPSQFPLKSLTLYSSSLVDITLLCLFKKFPWYGVLSYLYSRATVCYAERQFWHYLFHRVSWISVPSMLFQVALAIPRGDISHFLLCCRERLSGEVQDNIHVDRILEMLIMKEERTGLRRPWEVSSTQQLYKTLQRIIADGEINTALVDAKEPPKDHCDLAIDNKLFVKMSERDRVMVALVLLYRPETPKTPTWVCQLPSYAPACFKECFEAYPEMIGKPTTRKRFIADHHITI